MNILVGPNNCGKSTILGVFRVLDAGLRRARAKRPEILEGPDGHNRGYPIPDDSIPISLENAHTDYSEAETTVRFRLSNGNKLLLYFPKEGGCRLFSEVEGRRPETTVQFQRAFPVALCVVPVLGPLEHEEEVVQPETVRRNLTTHRASRHFRNFWHHYPEGFAEFATLVKNTWPGMEIQRPERTEMLDSKLRMFCLEDRITRELFWAGFGFQIWCQLLTHLIRATSDSFVVIDEPEIYLHPDVQRQFLNILRDLKCDALLATHSTEIIGDAEPTEILSVDKTERAARRLKNIDAVQEAIERIGSIQNITLSQLARHRRVLFVEDLEDFKLLRRFARVVGLTELSSASALSPVEAAGAAWKRVKAVAWGIEKIIGNPLKIGVVFDPDYRSKEEIDEILKELRKQVAFAHFHGRKEIENYLLVSRVLERALSDALAERSARSGDEVPKIVPIHHDLEKITDSIRVEVQAQYLAKRREWLQHTGRDDSTILAETTKEFEVKWANMEERVKIVPGKTVLRALRKNWQERYAVSVSNFRIVSAFQAIEIPGELADLLVQLDEFSASGS